MTVVRVKLIGVPLPGYFESHIEWCRNNVDEKDVEWDLYKSTVHTFVFNNPVDAVAFKLRFGL